MIMDLWDANVVGDFLVPFPFFFSLKLCFQARLYQGAEFCSADWCLICVSSFFFLVALIECLDAKECICVVSLEKHAPLAA